MDASRQNSPSRKSRFRAQGPSAYRPAEPVEDPSDYAEPDATAHEGEVLPADETAAAAEGMDQPSERPVEEYAPVEENTPGEALAYETQTDRPAYEAPPPEPEDALPAGLRLTRTTDRVTDHRRRMGTGIAIGIGVTCLAAGGALGYFLHGNAPVAGMPGSTTPPTTMAAPTMPLAPQTLVEVDAGFDAVKQGKFADARKRFTDLADKHPIWPSMRIEAARASLYEHDFEKAGQILLAILRAKPNADAEFLSGLLEMTTQTYDKSEAAFARAVAVDPSRPDIFYFWGECLRRQGKPQDAAIKFHQALIRNQYETTEGLYTLKLWLSEIQADQEAKAANEKIDADLASGHPSGPALFADAARALKAGKPADAAARIAQAQKVMEPAVFKVILQDPIFLQENFRPELAPLYK